MTNNLTIIFHKYIEEIPIEEVIYSVFPKKRNSSGGPSTDLLY